MFFGEKLPEIPLNDMKFGIWIEGNEVSLLDEVLILTFQIKAILCQLKKTHYIGTTPGHFEVGKLKC